MVSRGIDAPRVVGGCPGLLVVLGLAVLASACEQPRPRSFTEYMDDPVARDGTLARCNQDRGATEEDPECVNARRAAAAVAAREEAAQREQRESESEQKRAAMRAQIAAQQAAAQRAEASAAAAAEAAYEAQWTNPEGVTPPPGSETAVVSPRPQVPTPPVIQPTPDGAGAVAVQEAPASQASPGDELSLVDPAQYVPAQPQTPAPKLEELTIPRPFRSLPEPE